MLTYEPIVHYIISSVMQAFWLVLTHDLLEDWHIDDVIIKTFFNSLLYKTKRFQVAVHLFSNRSQRTSTCGKNISNTLGCATFLFLPYFDIICDQLLNRHMATWNLFVKQKNSNMESIYLFYNTLTWVGKHPMQGNVAQFFWWSEKFLLLRKFCNIAKILWCSTNFFTIYFVLGIKPNNL